MNRIARFGFPNVVKRIYKSDIIRQTVVCAGLVGFGDTLAQLYNDQRDSDRLIHMTCAGTFLGPWYKAR